MKYLIVLVCVCLTPFSSQLSLYDKDEMPPDTYSKASKSDSDDESEEVYTDIPTTSIPPEQNNILTNLKLTIDKDKFIGDLQIGKGKHNSSRPIKVKFNSVVLNISDLKCLNGPNTSVDCELCPTKDENELEITFTNYGKQYDDLQLHFKYEGKYSQDGLHDFRALGKGIYYVANLKSDGNPKIGNLMPYVDDYMNQPWQETEIEIEAKNYTFLPGDSDTGEPVNVLKTTLAFDKPFVIGKMKKLSSSTKIACYGNENEDYNTNDGEQLLEILTEHFEKYFESQKTPTIQLLVPTYLSEEMNTDGYITQRDSVMHNIEELSISRKQSAQLMLFYRFSQQWTVNSEKWLNLGLAAFFSNYYTDEVNKNTNFSALDQFIVDQLQSRAFQFDGYYFSKPLNYFTKTSQPYEQYDPILYSKGASVMMALMEICGKKFDDLLKNYFKNGNREGVDKFAEHFSECFDNTERGKSYFMKLNNNPGYPVIHIASENGKTKIKQETFYWTNNTQKDTWTIALKYKTASEEKTKWLNDLDNDIEDKDISIVNSHGYFRVNYERKKWDEIIAGLIKNGTSVASERVRARLINDLFSFARSTKQFGAETPDYVTALPLKDYLKNERQYLPLKAAFEEFKFLDFALYGGEIHKQFREYVKEIVEKLYARNGLTSTSGDSFHPLKIKIIASWACKLKVDACIKDAENEYLNLIKASSPVAAFQFNETHEVAACTVFRSSDILWYSAFSTLNLRDVHSKLIYITALGCSNNVNNLKKLFEYGLQSPFFSDCVSAIQAGGPENIEVLLKEIELNIEKIEKQMGLSEIVNVIKSFYGKLNDKNAEMLKKISERIKSADEIKSEVQTVFEEVTTWKNKKTKFLTNYLNGVGQVTPTALALFLSTVLSAINYIFHF